MKYYLNGHDFKYAAEEMLYSVLPAESWERLMEPPVNMTDALISTLQEKNGILEVSAEIEENGRQIKSCRQINSTGLDEILRKRAVSQAVKMTIYDTAVQKREYPPEWGALTGVRPAKFARMLLIEGYTRPEIRDILTQEYHISPERLELVMPCMEAALVVKKQLKPKEVSLYIGIPFCPSRCSYCSFVSNSIEKAGKYIVPYLEVLLKELEETAKASKQADLRILYIYIGGGTPTILTSEQLDCLLKAIRKHFNISNLKEFTVEAGRPDTITEEKLQILRKNGVGRISINPQSLDDTVLAGIGRRHTAQQFYDSMRLAREVGFDSINTDLIAGLDMDTEETFQHTVNEILRLNPENITIHTLAAKKGATRADRSENMQKHQLVEKMLNYANFSLRHAGYMPYYIYRQKFMAGGFENVGWCKPGKACFYNICMMEEIQDIISLGAGAITKFCSPDTNQIRRIANPKYPYEYISQKERILSARQKIAEYAK